MHISYIRSIPITNISILLAKGVALAARTTQSPVGSSARQMSIADFNEALSDGLKIADELRLKNRKNHATRRND